MKSNNAGDDSDEYKPDDEKLAESSEEPEGFGVDSEDSDEKLYREMTRATGKTVNEPKNAKDKGK
jgi:hypothetical protein